MSRPRAYQLMEAANVVGSLSTTVDTVPATERQARPLTKLAPEEQREAWHCIRGRADTNPGAFRAIRCLCSAERMAGAMLAELARGQGGSGRFGSSTDGQTASDYRRALEAAEVSRQ